MARLIPAYTQFLDGDGEPLDSGKLYFYEEGGTSTPKDTFSDKAENDANDNPIILSDKGYLLTDQDAPLGVFGSGEYTVVLTNSDGLTLQGPATPLFNDSTTDQFEAWLSSIFYDQYDISFATDELYYRSSIFANNNNNPASEANPTKWQPMNMNGQFWKTIDDEYTTLGYPVEYINLNLKSGVAPNPSTILLHADAKQNDMVVLYNWENSPPSLRVDSEDGKDVAGGPGPYASMVTDHIYYFVYDETVGWKMTQYIYIW